MIEAILGWFHSLYIHLGLTLGFIDDSPEFASFQITRVSFSPSTSANVMVGDKIKVNIFYKSNLKGKLVQIWAHADTEGMGGTYDPSGFESGSGVVSRCFTVSNEGLLDSVAIHVMHYSGQDILYETRAVNYNLIPNPERAALKEDGKGSKVRIKEIKVNRMTIRPNAQVRIGESIDVVIDYRNTADQETMVWATATMDHEAPGRYDSGEMPKNKTIGTITKSFQFHQPTRINGIYVHMVNVTHETIAEQWLDFPIEFVN